MSNRSIERRIVVGVTFAMAATILGSGALIFETYRSSARADGELSLTKFLEISAERLAAESVFASRPGPPGLPGPSSGLDAYPWICWRAEEFSELNRSANFPDVRLPKVEAREAGPEGKPTGLQFVEAVSAEGLHYRIVTASFVPVIRGVPDSRRGDSRGGRRERDRRAQGPPFRPDDQFLILVASPMQEEFERFAELAKLMLFGGVGALLAAALLIRTSVRRGMAPLGVLTRTIESLGQGNLDRTVKLPDAPLELVPIVEALERSRGQLADSFAREQRFTDDVAHELRTPLTGLRANLEVALRRERSLEELKSVLRTNLSSTLDLQQIVDSLLLLRRTRTVSEQTHPVDLREEIEQAFEEQRCLLDERSLTVTYNVEDGSPSTALGTLALVRRITSNLARNAADYANTGTSISVAFHAASGFLTLVVENHSNALCEETASRAFDPFWRADTARSADDQHVGLGLSIVEGCASALGGRAAVEAKDGTFRIAVDLPIA